MPAKIGSSYDRHTRKAARTLHCGSIRNIFRRTSSNCTNTTNSKMSLSHQSTEFSTLGDDSSVREVHANGFSINTSEVEAKLNEGNIQEAESSLREGLSLNFEEARALLGRLEYQRGNVEGALRVFEGIDLQAAIQRLQPSQSSGRKGRSNSLPQHAASLVLEAIYLKAKSLQKLGRLREAANECGSVLDTVEKIFIQGIPEAQVDTKLQETVTRAVELLPELYKNAGFYPEAISSYRCALLSQWNLDKDRSARIQKAFAVFLLYSGVEATPPSLAAQVEGSFVPRSNLEEAILLLMILLRKSCLGVLQWDPSVMEHLTFALSLCSQTSVLAKRYEEVLPGVYHRIDRWNVLALCYSAAGQNKAALNLLRKSLKINDGKDDFLALLVAGKICSEDALLAAEGVEYANKAIKYKHVKGVGLRVLGLCLGKQAKIASSDFERSNLQSEALKSLKAALALEPYNSDLIFELGVHYAEQRNLTIALGFAKRFTDMTAGSVLNSWRLLILILSAQQRFSDAEVVTDAALDETAKWDQGPLLRLKAKLKISQSQSRDAIETYKHLLALVQARKKTLKGSSQGGGEKDGEFEVWHSLANLYSSLSYWKDAEICLSKCRELKGVSAETLIAQGAMYEKQGKNREALVAYNTALLLDPSYVPCKVLTGALMLKMGSVASPAARGLLGDALRIEPTNRAAWYYLGLAHKNDGRVLDAADCFQAASMLEDLYPVESFSSLL